MTERHFDQELREFHMKLIEMATLTEETIFKAVEALKDRNIELADLVIADDEKIDEMELIIEEKAIDLLALYQPMAIDLRVITTGMKINVELERIADLTVNIAQCAKELAQQPILHPLANIPRLSVIARKMVKQAIDSFVQRDQHLAREVILSDPEADELKRHIQKELTYEYMVKDGSTAPRAIPMLLIARHLERICDHASNIAEDIIYMINAKVVKHHRERLSE